MPQLLNLRRPLRSALEGAFSRLLAIILIAFLGCGIASAQALREQPTPNSVWLDFRLLASNPAKMTPPPWLDSVVIESMRSNEAVRHSTIYRLAFRRFDAARSELLLRLFFEDLRGASPTVSAWSEIGSNILRRGPLGAGVGLPASESLLLPMSGVDYVEIEVPGNGSGIRGAFLACINEETSKAAIDFPSQSHFHDAFDNLPPSSPNRDDTTLFGRVKATVDPGVMKLQPKTAPTGTWQFPLKARPLLAVVSFEILDVDATAPPEILVNNQPLGPPSIHLPDLADPAYLGLVRPLDANMRFRYTGWLHAQKIVPGSALQAGSNTVIIQLHKESGAIAIRAVELQLKYNTPGLDYTISTSTP